MEKLSSLQLIMSRLLRIQLLFFGRTVKSARHGSSDDLGPRTTAAPLPPARLCKQSGKCDCPALGVALCPASCHCARCLPRGGWRDGALCDGAPLASGVLPASLIYHSRLPSLSRVSGVSQGLSFTRVSFASASSPPMIAWIWLHGQTLISGSLPRGRLMSPLRNSPSQQQVAALTQVNNRQQASIGYITSVSKHYFLVEHTSPPLSPTVNLRKTTTPV